MLYKKYLMLLIILILIHNSISQTSFYPILESINLNYINNTTIIQFKINSINTTYVNVSLPLEDYTLKKHYLLRANQPISDKIVVKALFKPIVGLYRLKITTNNSTFIIPVLIKSGIDSSLINTSFGKEDINKKQNTSMNYFKLIFFIVLLIISLLLIAIIYMFVFIKRRH